MQDADKPWKVTTPVQMDPHKLVRRVPLEPHQYLNRITKQSDIFVLAHFGIPRFDAQNWRMEIGGLIRSPLTLTMDDIRKLPKREVETFHQCAGFPKKHWVPTRRISNAVWSGADLKVLFDELGILPEARYLWSFGMDHGRFDDVSAPCYLKDMPLARLEKGDVILAYEVNGEPLDQEHGHPVRLMIPGYYGTNSVKWLSRMEIASKRADGPFTTLLYNDPVDPTTEDPNGATCPVWEIRPESLIVSPAPETKVGMRSIEIWGWAWADGGVTSVDVSTDGGTTWNRAMLDEQVERSWQKFRFRWLPEGAGDTVLIARAIGRNGLVQPLTNARNAAHSVQVTVICGN
ncbi:MAG: molybdopterin-dependent oxidoreductase [Hyphomonadaceae bacterium]|nr:molybdopterin-dependent oxidoreductase [Hyphomonadaceae bacterium]